MISRKFFYPFILLLLLLLSTLNSCRRRMDWIMFRGEQGRGATSNALYPPLGIKWKLHLQISDERTFAFNNSVVRGNTIYFGSTDGNFYALDIESGYMHWVFKTKGAINSIPFADGKNVYFGSNDGKVYAVSRKEGKEVWSFQTDSTVQSTILRYEDSIIFTSDGGSTYFLSPQGEQLFKIPNPVWHYDTFQVYEDVVYFAPGPPSRPHSFGAFDLNQRAYLWILDTAAMQATWYSFPALDGDYLFFATCAYMGQYWSFDYYAFMRKTGEIVWKYTDESQWGDLDLDIRDLFIQNLKLLDYMAPSLWKNLVVYTSGDTMLRAFFSKSGRLAWVRQFDFPTSSSPTIAGNRIYLGLRGDDYSPDGRSPRLVCLSAKNGNLMWEMDLDGALLSAPVIAGKWLIFGTDRNFFYVLEELF